MAGRPRANRDSIKGTHLSIRLTEKEVAALEALVAKANTENDQQHVLDVARWEGRSSTAKLVHRKPEPSKPATYADVVRALLQHEARIPRLYEHGFWQELREETHALDHLVDLANGLEAIGYRWDREAMLRKLIEEEWKRRRLKKVERAWCRSRPTDEARQEEWQRKANKGRSGIMPLVVCPHCTRSFELPPR